MPKIATRCSRTVDAHFVLGCFAEICTSRSLMRAAFQVGQANSHVLEPIRASTLTFWMAGFLAPVPNAT